ncbi:hypothetical protein B0I35DRAFT_481303 [Stachybotrys elegans]|uniref:FAD linked oxidase N-terminal domain-containing protein n=1 Tax=Stachybotrys elegans TaxID=80388 RepID=A0A8K0SG20_9HYPO|nr:hypothetical protein B0I35DRAFT_481303 [Stachybotrys elegans]
MVAGGRVAPVGVGGFISGGGISYLSPKYGWSCDTVQNFEIVLANGSIVNANAQENPDLWQALKGGPGNFGLITRYDMTAIEYADPKTAQIWGGLLTYDSNDYAVVESVIAAFVKFAESPPENIDNSGVVWWAYNQALGGISLIACIDNVANNPNAPGLDGFRVIPFIGSTLRSDTIVGITGELAGGHGLHYINMVAAYRNDSRIIRFAMERHEQLIRDIEAVVGTEGTGLGTQCQFQPISQQMVAHSQANGGNSLSLESRVALGNGINWQINIGVNSAENATALLPLLEQMYHKVDAYATSLDANWDWVYLNYAFGTQDPIRSTGPETIKRLKAISRKYDPEGAFQKLRAAGFKIPL